MRSRTTAFCYEEPAAACELTMAPLAAAEALGLLELAAAVRVTDFGATRVGRSGWTDADDLPALSDVAALIALLSADVGLLVLEAEVEGLGLLSCREDRVCRLRTTTRAPLVAAIARLAPPVAGPRLTAWLRAHPGRWVACAPDGTLTPHASLDAFLTAT